MKRTIIPGHIMNQMAETALSNIIRVLEKDFYEGLLSIEPAPSSALAMDSEFIPIRRILETKWRRGLLAFWRREAPFLVLKTERDKSGEFIVKYQTPEKLSEDIYRIVKEEVNKYSLDASGKRAIHIIGDKLR